MSNSINTCGNKSIVTEHINIGPGFRAPAIETEIVSNSINTCGSKSIVMERINIGPSFRAPTI